MTDITEPFDLIVVGAGAAGLATANRAVDLGGRKIAGTIQQEQITLVEIAIGFQDFAALHLPKDVLIGRPQVLWR